MIIKQVQYNDIVEAVGSIRFRNQDILESMQFGAKNILDNYQYNRYARYFIIYKQNQPIVPIQINRDGFISFFISDGLTISDSLSLVKLLKKALKWYTDNYETTLFVKTMNWYKEANKLNALIGFRKYVINKDYSIWVYENNRYVKPLEEVV